jgi:mono/diheme cytochrome c family protein
VAGSNPLRRHAGLGILALTMTALAATAPGQSAKPANIVRGEYLVTIGVCASCHTPRDANGEWNRALRLSGGKGGPLTAPNLTSDTETGLGNWTDDQIVDALRNGRRPDGSSIRPPMGVFFYRNLSDRDVRSIVAYLRSLPPVKNKVVRTPLSGPAPSFTPVTSVPEPDSEDRVRYGQYLAEAVAHCLQCHSPRIKGLPDLSRAGAGGNAYIVRGGGTVVAPNLTPANPYGIAKWTDEEIKTAITHGVRPNGSQLVPVMDFEMYAAMTPDDLSKLVAYLRTLKPVASE